MYPPPPVCLPCYLSGHLHLQFTRTSSSSIWQDIFIVHRVFTSTSSPSVKIYSKISVSTTLVTEDIPPWPTHLPTRRQRTSLSVDVIKSSWSGVHRRINVYSATYTLHEFDPSSSHPIRSLPHYDRSIHPNESCSHDDRTYRVIWCRDMIGNPVSSSSFGTSFHHVLYIDSILSGE